MSTTDSLSVARHEAQMNLISKWAAENVVHYLNGEDNEKSKDEINNINNLLVEKDEFKTNFFGDDEEVCRRSRSAVMEWLQVIHLQVARVCTRDFEGMDGLNNLILDKADELRELEQHGKLYWSILIMTENLKMLLSLTDPDVIYNGFGFDRTPKDGGNHLRVHYYDVTQETIDAVYEIAHKLVIVLDHIHMPTQPPACITMGRASYDSDVEEEENKEEMDTGVSSDGDDPYGKDEGEEEESETEEKEALTEEESL
jgi:hypothetical protein